MVYKPRIRSKNRETAFKSVKRTPKNREKNGQDEDKREEAADN